MVKIEGLTKSFGSHSVFRDLTLEFPRGELSVIMGPSGCGKSTLLRCINFLELFDRGRISIGELSVAWNDQEVSALPPSKRTLLQKMRLKTGMVFQNFNLFPHLTVLENVTLAPIQVKSMKAAEAAGLAEGILERVGLADKVDKYPSTLSGTVDDYHFRIGGYYLDDYSRPKRANIFCPYAIGFSAKEIPPKVLIRTAGSGPRWLRSKA